jgi:DtxR family transcriptional regulator, iron-dependent repressor
VSGIEREVDVVRLAEPIQTDEYVMGILRRVGAQPGRSVVVLTTGRGVRIVGNDDAIELSADAASHLFVRSA